MRNPDKPDWQAGTDKQMDKQTQTGLTDGETEDWLTDRGINTQMKKILVFPARDLTCRQQQIVLI